MAWPISSAVAWRSFRLCDIVGWTQRALASGGRTDQIAIRRALALPEGGQADTAHTQRAQASYIHPVTHATLHGHPRPLFPCELLRATIRVSKATNVLRLCFETRGGTSGWDMPACVSSLSSVV